MASDFTPDTSDFTPDTSDFTPDTPTAQRAIPTQNLDMSGMPPLTSQWEATKYGLGQAAGGAIDVLKSAAQMAFAPPQNQTEKYLTMIPGGVQIKRALQGAAPSLSDVRQVPGAIKDLMNAPDALKQLAAVAPRAGGQGAAAYALAKAPAALDAIPSFARAKANFKLAQAANATPIDLTGPAKAALDVKELSDAGGQMPAVVRKFLKRISDPTKPPLDYATGRKFYSNASRLSINEYQTYNAQVQHELGNFTRALGNSIQEAANNSGVGPEHATAMSEYHRASAFKDTKSSLKKDALRQAANVIGGGIGGYLFSKLSGK